MFENRSQSNSNALAPVVKMGVNIPLRVEKKTLYTFTIIASNLFELN